MRLGLQLSRTASLWRCHCLTGGRMLGIGGGGDVEGVSFEGELGVI